MLNATFRSFIANALIGSAYEGTTIYPGPEVPDLPDRFVVVTRTGGPGYSVEGLFDGIEWQVRVAGNQADPDDADVFARFIDQYLLTQGGSQTLNGDRIASIYRSGSAPSPLLVDDADRTHFVCSYITDVESASSH